MTFPIAQIAKRPGIEGVKVAKVMSTYHTYSSAPFNSNTGYELMINKIQGVFLTAPPPLNFLSVGR